MKENKNKHMTFQDRIEIQEGLFKGKTFKEIGETIRKHKTTISKGVRLHAQQHKTSFSKREDLCPMLLKQIIPKVNSTLILKVEFAKIYIA